MINGNKNEDRAQIWDRPVGVQKNTCPKIPDYATKTVLAILKTYPPHGSVYKRSAIPPFSLLKPSQQCEYKGEVKNYVDCGNLGSLIEEHESGNFLSENLLSCRTL